MGSKKVHKVVTFTYDPEKRKLVKKVIKEPESPEVIIIEDDNDDDNAKTKNKIIDTLTIENDSSNNLEVKNPEPSCSICHMKFLDKDNLIQHSLDVHLEAKPFACPKCYQHFRYLSLFYDHVKDCQMLNANVSRSVDYKPKPFPQCDICSRKFRTTRLLICHRNHDHKDYGQLHSELAPCNSSDLSISNSNHQSNLHNMNDRTIVKSINQKFNEAVFKLSGRSANEFGFQGYLEDKVPTVPTLNDTFSGFATVAFSSQPELNFSSLSQLQNFIKPEVQIPELPETANWVYRCSDNLTDAVVITKSEEIIKTINESDEDTLSAFTNSDGVANDVDPEMPILTLKSGPILHQPTLLTVDFGSQVQLFPLVMSSPPQLTKIKTPVAADDNDDFCSIQANTSKSAPRVRRTYGKAKHEATETLAEVIPDNSPDKVADIDMDLKEESEDAEEEVETDTDSSEPETSSNARYPCTSCRKGFCTSLLRLEHMRNHHPKDLRFGCQNCAQRFFSKVALSNHYRAKVSCDGRPPDIIIPKYELTADGKKVICPYCKNLMSRGNLKRHIRTLHFKLPRERIWIEVKQPKRK